MKNKNSQSNKRLEKIRTKVEKMIEKNRDEVGTGKTIGEIEQDLLSGILEVGKLLLEDRLIEEESELEDKGYEVKGKKNKEPRSSKS